ncbi:MAG: ABC transporter permease [Betaproteobacteria bacterium]
MAPATLTRSAPTRFGRAARARAAAWQALGRLAATVLALAFTPSSYRGEPRRALARQLVLGAGPNLAIFLVVATLLALVLIRIVVATAAAYGLSHLALQTVLRVLAMELIPLAAAVFVALRIALPRAIELVALHRTDPALATLGRLQVEVLPRALVCVYAVVLLALASWVVVGVLAYFAVHGYTAGGLAGFVRTVGQTVTPTSGLIFAVKTLLFGFAVALLPLAAAAGVGADRGFEARGLLRVFMLLLLVQAAALLGNYA